MFRYAVRRKSELRHSTPASHCTAVHRFVSHPSTDPGKRTVAVTPLPRRTCSCVVHDDHLVSGGSNSLGLNDEGRAGRQESRGSDRCGHSNTATPTPDYGHVRGDRWRSSVCHIVDVRLTLDGGHQNASRCRRRRPKRCLPASGGSYKGIQQSQRTPRVGDITASNNRPCFAGAPPGAVLPRHIQRGRRWRCRLSSRWRRMRDISRRADDSADSWRYAVHAASVGRPHHHRAHGRQAVRTLQISMLGAPSATLRR